MTWNKVFSRRSHAHPWRPKGSQPDREKRRATKNRVFKQRRFWATYVNRNWTFCTLSRDFEKLFWQIVSIRIKTLVGNTNMVASRLIKRENAHFPLTCVTQKRRCLSSLFAPARFYIRAPRCGALHNPSTKKRLYVILWSVLYIRHQWTYDIHGQFSYTLIQSGIWKWRYCCRGKVNDLRVTHLYWCIWFSFSQDFMDGKPRAFVIWTPLWHEKVCCHGFISLKVL